MDLESFVHRTTGKLEVQRHLGRIEPTRPLANMSSPMSGSGKVHISAGLDCESCAGKFPTYRSA